MYNKQLIGKNGETIACEFLKNNNYIILERNFRCRQGEIDIIAKDNSTCELVFLEVKTRTNFKYGKPAESVNKLKKQHIYRAIEYYIYLNNIIKLPIRIDVIEININDKKYKLNHIKQAF